MNIMHILIENQININIIDYVKEVNKFEFKIDIPFIDEFIELVNKNECCIHHNMLQKYGIISLNGTTNDIKRILEQNKFIENADYLLRNVAQQLSSGTKYKNEYYLHPRAFKICLMRSLKTKIYARYYLLLEECIKYFNDYQDKLKEIYIIKLKTKLIKKDNKIDLLEEKLNTIIEHSKETKIMNEKLIKQNDNTKIMNEKLIKQNDETHKMNKELLKSNKFMEISLNKANHKLDETLEKLEEIYEELENTNEELEETTHKS